jgi:hypothetical protein
VRDSALRLRTPDCLAAEPQECGTTGGLIRVVIREVADYC